MTKSFLEIAREISERAEDDLRGRVEEMMDAYGGEFYPTQEQFANATTVTRDCELAIEAILRREFGDNSGPALERSFSAASSVEAKIDKKTYA